MGDSTRNIVFAKWIYKHYPKVKSILVVADGQGELSWYLIGQGYKVTTIEPKPRHLRRGVKVVKSFFTADTEVKADLIVGMHPDEAALEIVLHARKSHKPFAVVPCCVKAMSGHERYLQGVGDVHSWVRKLRDIIGHSQTRVFDLRISGANTVLYRVI
jgi:hypothetical protein